MQQSGLNEKKDQEEKGNSPGSESIDALVSGFLEELASISPDGKEVHQLEVVEAQAVDKPPEPEPEPPVPGPAAADGDAAVSGIDFEGINREIEESLSELERLKSKVVPITDRKDTKADTAASAGAMASAPLEEAKAGRTVAGRPANAPAPGLPASAPASKPGVGNRPESGRLPESPDAEEQAWDRLELFRSQVVSHKPHRGLKSALGIAIVVIILAVPAYQLFKLRSNQDSRYRAALAGGQASSSEPDVSKIRMKAESITKVAPTYPRLPRKQRIEGTVVLEADINEKGDVVRAMAISGPNQLRKAAEEALMKWKFKPASVNGVSIASKEQIPITFEPPR